MGRFDQSPIMVVVNGKPVQLAAIGWRVQLAIWFLRRYVEKAVRS
jgi:hypothetical protein